MVGSAARKSQRICGRYRSRTPSYLRKEINEWEYEKTGDTAQALYQTEAGQFQLREIARGVAPRRAEFLRRAVYDIDIPTPPSLKSNAHFPSDWCNHPSDDILDPANRSGSSGRTYSSSRSVRRH